MTDILDEKIKIIEFLLSQLDFSEYPGIVSFTDNELAEVCLPEKGFKIIKKLIDENYVDTNILMSSGAAQYSGITLALDEVRLRDLLVSYQKENHTLPVQSEGEPINLGEMGWTLTEEKGWAYISQNGEVKYDGFAQVGSDKYRCFKKLWDNAGLWVSYQDLRVTVEGTSQLSVTHEKNTSIRNTLLKLAREKKFESLPFTIHRQKGGILKWKP